MYARGRYWALISSAIICIKSNIKFHVIILFLLHVCIQIKLLNGLLIYPLVHTHTHKKENKIINVVTKIQRKIHILRRTQKRHIILNFFFIWKCNRQRCNLLCTLYEIKNKQMKLYALCEMQHIIAHNSIANMFCSYFTHNCARIYKIRCANNAEGGKKEIKSWTPIYESPLDEAQRTRKVAPILIIVIRPQTFL